VAGELVLRVSIAGGHVELRQPQTLQDQLELGAPRLQIRPVGGEGERAWLVAHDGLNLFPLHEVDRAVQQHTPIAPGRLESGLVVRERVRIEPDEAFRDVERRCYEGVEAAETEPLRASQIQEDVIRRTIVKLDLLEDVVAADLAGRLLKVL